MINKLLTIIYCCVIVTIIRYSKEIGAFLEASDEYTRHMYNTTTLQPIHGIRMIVYLMSFIFTSCGIYWLYVAYIFYTQKEKNF